MRILHLNTYDIQGGAARAVRRLHGGLCELGQDSRMLVLHKASSDKRVIAAELGEPDRRAKWARKVYRHGIMQNRTPRSNTPFSLPEPSWDIRRHPAVWESEVLHLHWVAEFLSRAALASLARAGRPMVWTLHDQRAFTGGCHFSAGCDQYQTDCGRCPQLQRWADRLPRAVLADALRDWLHAPVTLVSPSRWLADCARGSALFREARIEVIPNGLDTRVFCPQDRRRARAEHGLPESAAVFLFGADCVNERRKGWSALAAGLAAAMEDSSFRHAVHNEKVIVVSFGDRGDEPLPLALPVRRIGRVTADAALARLYSAADVVLLPSLEDNLPNVMLEALCCGTPLLAHRVGGIPDVVVDGRHGLLVPPEEPGSFAEALRRLAAGATLREQMAAACREEMPPRFALEVQAKRYLSLYEELQTERPAAARPGTGTVCPAGAWGREFHRVAKRIIWSARGRSLWRRLAAGLKRFGRR